MSKHALITGSAGLVGSEAVRFFVQKGYRVTGIDNDMRKYFFGETASTKWNQEKIMKECAGSYVHHEIDIRNEDALQKIFRSHPYDIIIHTAAQPSHDWAAREPLTDFTVNALATAFLLEQYRAHCPDATFIFLSTNKVYGDRPNTLALEEFDQRYDIAPAHRYYQGIDESMSIDDCTHSLFGASKVAADVLVQEYGKYFGLKTAVVRAGCISGPAHSGAMLHGFLSYLARCVATGRKYTIFGYKGKQVRDNIHSKDLVNMFWHLHQAPRCGEVYNVGGGRHSNVSVLEAIHKFEKALHAKAVYEFIEAPRKGDHIWYISDIAKFKSHYPSWNFSYDINSIIEEICRSEILRK